MNKRRIKQLKVISIFCVLILLAEIIYVSYSLFYKNKESLYFDGMNAIVSNDSFYVAVGSNNDNVHSYEKAKLSKYNRNRVKNFEKLYNVGYNSAFFGVAMDEEYIIAVGSYEKNEEDHEESVRRALIVKYDKDGNVLFESDFKILDNSKFTSVVVVEDGYIVTGQTIYKTTRVGSKEGGALLVKYDKDGNLVWSTTYGNNKSATFNDLLVYNGYIYTVGTHENHIGIICKYDLNGGFITYNDYLYTDDIGFSGIVELNNYLYVSGSNRDGKQSANAMIVQYDLDCTYIGQAAYEAEGSVRYNKLITDSNNYLIAIGIAATQKKSNNRSADTFNYDGLIAKYDSSLKEIEVVMYGDERDDYFTDIILDHNQYLVVGYSSYEDGSYLSKFIRYSDALKVLGVES